MKEKFGKNEASHISKKNTVIMIVSLIAVALFIGTALQPAIASPNIETGIKVEEIEDKCSICRPRERPLNDDPDPSCQTCLCAVGVAVGHAISSTKQNISEQIKKNGDLAYAGLLGDIVLWLIEGLAEGIKISGFKIELDKDKLNETINYYVNEYVGPQGHNLTKILVALQAISIGIRVYLISLCVEGKQILPLSARIMKFFSNILSEFLIKIFLLKV